MSDPLVPELAIQKALKAALKAIDPDIKTALENVNFIKPPATEAYQEVTFVTATPGNAEKGGSLFLETGYMQVSLRFPGGKGTGPGMTRARAIRSVFNIEASFVADGITTNIGATPKIMPGFNDDVGRYVVTVRVPFNAQLPN